MTKENNFNNFSYENWGHYLDGLQESINHEEYLICTYFVQMGRGLDPWYIGKIIVREQTIGSYLPLQSDPKEILRKFSAKVIGVYEVPPYEIGLPEEIKERQYIIQVAYPIQAVDTQVPLLMTTIAGNISLGGKIKLLDVKFPNQFLDSFLGPKFGIQGIRKILDVTERPLLANINHTYNLKDGATQFYEAAMGGADIIKDNEQIAGDVKYLPLESRVTKYMELKDMVKEETKEDTIYAVNITAEPNKIFENAERAIQNGVNGLMVNYLTVGLPVVRNLAEDPSIKVPILGHMDHAGVFYSSDTSGISSLLIMGKLARLVGLDILVYPGVYGKAPFLRDKYLSCAKALRYPFGHLKPVLPMPSGGVTPGTVLKLIQDLDRNILIGAGSGIHSHPQGTRAGTKAFRQAIEIGMNPKLMNEALEDLEDFIEDNTEAYPELAAAYSEFGEKGISYLPYQ